MTEYVVSAALNKVLERVMADKTKTELNAIREQELKIDALLKVKTSKEGDNQPCGGPVSKAIKVSGVWQLYADSAYIIVVDNYFFTTGDDNTVEGMVFNALQEIDVKVVKGEIKLAKRRPEIEFFTATVAHYGAISTALIALKECLAIGTKRFVGKVASGSLEEPTTEEQPPSGQPPEDEAPPAEEPKPKRGGRKT